MHEEHQVEPVVDDAPKGTSFIAPSSGEKKLEVPAAIVFTGERRNNHYRVDVCHCPLELTASAIGCSPQCAIGTKVFCRSKGILPSCMIGKTAQVDDNVI